ncbi:MAG: FKBP-type peptidyl-prolyl cis-trans isomerase, partial [Bacteroidota bacterium]
YRYLLHVDSGGTHPKKGDYVTIELVCHVEDSVLLDTRKGGAPYRLRLEEFPFVGCYEEGLTNIGQGDSATFFVPADSLFEFLFRRAGNDSILQEQTLLKKGTSVMYDVKMLKVQGYVEAEQEMQMQYSKMEKKEKAILKEFIEKNKINVKPDAQGIYKVLPAITKTVGLPADSGSLILLYFRARLMDGTIFNSTKEGMPFQFVLGQDKVIKAWQIYLKGVKRGENFSLIVPSSMAYGEEGLLDSQTGRFMVPPYSTIIYDFVVAGVEPPGAAGTTVSRK